MGSIVKQPEDALRGAWGDDIDKLVIPPTRWIVNGLIPHGFTLLAGAPKIGKSILTTQLCAAIAGGNDFISGYGVEKGKSLFLTFEEPVGDIRERTHLLNGKKTPSDMAIIDATEVKGMGIPWLLGVLDAHPEISLVVLDTIWYFHNDNNVNRNIYNSDIKFIRPFRELAEKRRISIIGVTHTNQNETAVDVMNRVHGSNGLIGTAKSIFIMGRTDRSSESAIVIGVGRKIAQITLNIDLDVDRMCWGIGDSCVSSSINERILTFLAVYGSPVKHAEIANNIEVKQCYKQLAKLVGDRKVVNRSGFYSLPSI